MRSDIMLGVILGTVMGATLATYYKPAQKVVKKSAEAIKSEANNMLNRDN